MKVTTNFWERLAIGVVTVLLVITMKWVDGISLAVQDLAKSQSEHSNALIHRGAASRTTVWVMQENMRNIHHELEINRRLLNRIDKNTGGTGEEPDVRALLDPPDEMRQK